MKVISVAVAVTLFLTSAAYSVDLPDKRNLRTQILTSTKEGRERIIKTTERTWFKSIKSNKTLRQIIIAGAALTIMAGGIILTMPHQEHREFLQEHRESLREFLQEHRESLKVLDLQLSKVLDMSNEILKPDIRFIVEEIDVSDLKPGDVNLVFTSHGSAGDFGTLRPLLDNILAKAKSEHKKIVWYSESSVPNTAKEVDMIFPGLEVKRVFEDSLYRRKFEKLVEKRQTGLSEFLDGIAKGRIETEPIKESNLETMEGFIFSELRYVRGKALDGYDIEFIPEQPKIETYLTGLKEAAAKDRKEIIERSTEVNRLRDIDFSEFISGSSVEDSYIIVIIGLGHIKIKSILQDKGLNTNTFVSKKVIENLMRAIEPVGKSLENFESFRNMNQLL